MLLREFIPKKTIQIMLSGNEKWEQVSTFIQLILQQKKREARLYRMCTNVLEVRKEDANDGKHLRELREAPNEGAIGSTLMQ